jgi:hypothetical protein
MADLQDVVNSLNQLGKALGVGPDGRADLNASDDQVNKRTETLFQIEALSKAMAGLSSSLQRMIPVQESLISSNRLLNNATDLTFAQLQTLDGGFAAANENIARLIDAGLDPNNEALLNLAGRVSVLGQNIEGLVKTNERLVGNGIVSQKNLTKLNKSLLDTSIEQGISIDRLVGSLDSLSNNLNLAVLGGDSFQKSSGILLEAAKILPKSALGNVQNLVDKVFDPNNFEKLAALGLQDIAGGQVDPSIALQRLIDQGKALADQTQGQGLENAKALYDVFGQDFVQLLEALYNAEKLNPQQQLLKEQEDAFDKSISDLKARLTGPLDQIAAATLNTLTVAIEALSNSVIFTEYIPKLASFIEENGAVIGAGLAGLLTALGLATAVATATFVVNAAGFSALTLGLVGIVGGIAAAAAIEKMSLSKLESINQSSQDSLRIQAEEAKRAELERMRRPNLDTRFNEFARRFMETNIGELSLINRRSNPESREIARILTEMRDDQRRNGSEDRFGRITEELAGS